MPGFVVARWRLAAVGILVAVLIACVAFVVIGAHGMRHRSGLAAPHLLALTYGEFEPRGASTSFLGLRLTATERGGQILAIDFNAYRGAGATADSKCGIGGRRSGQIETFYTPFNLRPGPQTVQITARGSACGSSKRTRSATGTFHIYVRRTDAPGREPRVRPTADVP